MVTTCLNNSAGQVINKSWQFSWLGDFSHFFCKIGNFSQLGSIAWCVSFPGGSVVKNLPAMQEMWVQSLGQEDPLEKEMATCSSIPAWEIRWTEEPGRLRSMGWHRVQHNLVTKQQHMYTYKICNYIFLIKLKKNSKEIMTFIINRP